MDDIRRTARHAVGRTLDREMDLVASAIAHGRVAAVPAASTVGGLRFGEAAARDRARRMAAEPGVRLVPAVAAGRGRHRHRASSGSHDLMTGDRDADPARRGRREPAADPRPPPARPGLRRRRGRVGRGRGQRARRAVCGPPSSCSTSTCPATPAGPSCAATALAAAGSPPVVVASAMTVSPAPACASSASPAICPSPSRSRRCVRPSSGCSPKESDDADDRPPDPPDRRSSCVLAFAGYLALCDRVRAMNVLELLAGARRRVRLRLPAVGAAAPRGLLIVPVGRPPDARRARGRDHRSSRRSSAATSPGSWRASGPS